MKKILSLLLALGILLSACLAETALPPKEENASLTYEEIDRYLASLVRGHAGEAFAGVNLSRLEKRLAQMQEMDAGVLFLWARAFWKSPAAGRENIARYAGAD